MAKKRNLGRPGGWVQDTTLYIPPTSTVSEVNLRPEWRALTSARLAKKLKLKDWKRWLRPGEKV